jgi:choline-sulfatase
MVRDRDLKLIWSEPDGAQLFNLADDPYEQRDRANDTELASEKDRLVALVQSHWDSEDLRRRILQSQQRRLFLNAASAVAGPPSWDFQPAVDASKQYVRSGMSPAITKGKARFPPEAPVPPDHPRDVEPLGNGVGDKASR